MAMASSSSSADPPNIRPFSNLPSRDPKPLISLPLPYTSPSPVHTAQPLPVVGAGKTLNSHTQMAKIQDSPVPPPQGILYPVLSSGRGFIPKTLRPQSSDQLVTVANPGGFPPRSVVASPNPVRPFGFPPAGSQVHPVHMMRPPHMQPLHFGSRQMGGAVSGANNSIPVGVHPKVALPPSSASDLDRYKDLRGRSGDETIVTIRDRKVRISNDASLYALCRSWLHNGLSQESQPQFGEGAKKLPRPLPMTLSDSHLPTKNEHDDAGEEKEEDVGSVEHLSSQDLLQRHIKRSKRIRARLREKRLQRIARYKKRLALLLPSPVEQLRNDT